MAYVHPAILGNRVPSATPGTGINTQDTLLQSCVKVVLAVSRAVGQFFSNNSHSSASRQEDATELQSTTFRFSPNSSFIEENWEPEPFIDPSTVGEGASNCFVEALQNLKSPDATNKFLVGVKSNPESLPLFKERAEKRRACISQIPQCNIRLSPDMVQAIRLWLHNSGINLPVGEPNMLSPDEVVHAQYQAYAECALAEAGSRILNSPIFRN